MDDISQKDKKIPRMEGANVVVKKPNAAKKIASSLFVEDAKNVGNYLLNDVVIPSVKDTISSIVSNGIDMLLFGEGGKAKRRSSSSSIFGTLNYNAISTSKAKNVVIGGSKDTKSTNSYDRVQADELIFETRAQCQEAIYRMHDVMDEYKLLSIADLYDIVGLPTSYTDNNYGWDDISGAEPVRLPNGTYLLKLPKVKPLN